MQDVGQMRKVQVDFEGLMQVVGANLYSTPMVAVRELVQNAHDSCVRRRIERAERGADPEEYEPSIRVRVTGEEVLEVIDNGAGLTRQEVIDCLATIGAGFTRQLRQRHAEAELIGAFGLGFLSAYVLGERVEVLTTSWKAPEERWKFASHTGEFFTLSEAEATGVIGTTVRVHLKQEHHALADVERLAQILELYCCLLPLPIELEGGGRINEAAPPWMLDDATLNDAALKQIKMTFAQRFERAFEPIATLDIPPLPEAGFRGGLAWVQDGGSYATSDHRSASIFVRGMLVTRAEQEILPTWAGFVGAVLDSRDLTPTASREDLIRDEVWEATRAHVRRHIIEGLEHLARREPAAWRRTLRRHNEALLGAAIADDRLFALVWNQLTVPTTEGNLHMREILKRSSKVHISIFERGGPDEVLFRAMQTPIIDGMRYAVYPFVKRVCAQKGRTLVELGTEQGNAQMFPHVALDAGATERLEALLGRPGIEVIPTRFAPATLPLVLAHDEEIKLKRKLEDDEADKRISRGVLGLARLYTSTIDDALDATLYVNLDARSIQALLDSERPVDDPDVRAGAGLLWGIATLMAPNREEPSFLEDALATIGTHIRHILT